MRQLLKGIQGPFSGAVYVLGERVTFGRAPDVDIQILHPEVSRHHAKITRRDEDGEYVLLDLGSDNGTRVGRERIDRRVLVSGDRIVIHKSIFEFVETNDDSVATSPVFEGRVRSFESMRQTLVLKVAEAPVVRRERDVIVQDVHEWTRGPLASGSAVSPRAWAAGPGQRSAEATATVAVAAGEPTLAPESTRAWAVPSEEVARSGLDARLPRGGTMFSLELAKILASDDDAPMAAHAAIAESTALIEPIEAPRPAAFDPIAAALADDDLPFVPTGAQPEGEIAVARFALQEPADERASPGIAVARFAPQEPADERASPGIAVARFAPQEPADERASRGFVGVVPDELVVAELRSTHAYGQNEPDRESDAFDVHALGVPSPVVVSPPVPEAFVREAGDEEIVVDLELDFPNDPTSLGETAEDDAIPYAPNYEPPPSYQERKRTSRRRSGLRWQPSGVAEPAADASSAGALGLDGDDMSPAFGVADPLHDASPTFAPRGPDESFEDAIIEVDPGCGDSLEMELDLRVSAADSLTRGTLVEDEEATAQYRQTPDPLLKLHATRATVTTTPASLSDAAVLEQGTAVLESEEHSLVVLGEIIDYRALRIRKLQLGVLPGRDDARFELLRSRLHWTPPCGEPALERRFRAAETGLDVRLTDGDGSTCVAVLEDISVSEANVALELASARSGDVLLLTIDLPRLRESLRSSIVFKARVASVERPAGRIRLSFAGPAKYVEQADRSQLSS